MVLPACLSPTKLLSSALPVSVCLLKESLSYTVGLSVLVTGDWNKKEQFIIYVGVSGQCLCNNFHKRKGSLS